MQINGISYSYSYTDYLLPRPVWKTCRRIRGTSNIVDRCYFHLMVGGLPVWTDNALPGAAAFMIFLSTKRMLGKLPKMYIIISLQYSIAVNIWYTAWNVYTDNFVFRLTLESLLRCERLLKGLTKKIKVS